MSFDRCPRCCNFGFLDSHVCPPLWYCSQYPDFDKDTDLNETYATDEKEAAEKYSEKLDFNEGTFEVEEKTIYVKSPSSDDVKVLRVFMELLPHYKAQEGDPSD